MWCYRVAGILEVPLSKAIEANNGIVIEKRVSFFGEISYFC